MSVVTITPDRETEPKDAAAPPPANGITEEQKQAIMALAGKWKEGPMMDMWVEEMRKFKERIRQEEIARQDAELESK